MLDRIVNCTYAAAPTGRCLGFRTAARVAHSAVAS